MTDSDDVVIEGFRKSKSEIVVGVLNNWNGTRYAHIRVMRPALEEDGWVRGPGVAIDARRISELVETVRRLRDVAALDKVIGEVSLGREAILVGVQRWNGNQYAFVRRHYRDKKGAWQPTKKGVNIPTEQIEDLIALAEALEKASLDPP